MQRKIKNIKQFREATRSYEIERGFGKILSKGYSLFYGYDKELFLPGTRLEAWQQYKQNADHYDKFVTKGSWLDKKEPNS